jgi:hypothetical protein
MIAYWIVTTVVRVRTSTPEPAFIKKFMGATDIHETSARKDEK